MTSDGFSSKNSIPIKLVESFYLALMYIDVLVLSQFRSPEDIAVYYAAGKTLSFVALVWFSAIGLPGLGMGAAVVAVEVDAVGARHDGIGAR